MSLLEEYEQSLASERQLKKGKRKSKKKKLQQNGAFGQNNFPKCKQTGKFSYPNENTANAQALETARAVGNPLYVYRCTHCWQYHLTKETFLMRRQREIKEREQTKSQTHNATLDI